MYFLFFFFSSRRRHTRCSRDWSSDVCSSDLEFFPTDPAAKDWFFICMVKLLLVDHLEYRTCVLSGSCVAGMDRCDDDSIDILIFEERSGGCPVAIEASICHKVDRVVRLAEPRDAFFAFFTGRWREFWAGKPACFTSIGKKNPQPTTIGDNTHAISSGCWLSGKGACHVEK